MQCITGALPAVPYQIKQTEPEDKDLYDGKTFEQFFTELGYTTSWDFSARDRLTWHELYENGKLILQVEAVDLQTIIRDMVREEEFATSYFIAGEDEAAYRRLIEKVREKVNNG